MPALEWIPSDPAIFAGNAINALCSFGSTVYAGTEDNGSAQTLLVSTDGGNTWAGTGTDPFGSGGGVQAIAYQSDTLVVGGSDGADTTTIAVSTDGGNTWTSPVSDPFTGGSVLGLCFNGSTIVAVGESGAGHTIAISGDGGATWVSDDATDPFEGGTATCVVVSPNGFLIVGAGNSSPASLAVSTDGGTTWTTPTNPLSYGVYSLFVTGGIVYAGGAGIIVSSNDGSIWTSLTTPFDSGQCNALCLYGATLVGGGSGTSSDTLFTSDDGGATWLGAILTDPFSGHSALALVNVGGQVLAGSNDGGAPLAVGLPVPIIIPGPTGAHSYEVIVCDKWGIAKGQINSAVPTQIEWDLDDLGQALIDFWILDPSAAILPIADIPVIAEIQIWRDNVLIWWGVTVSCTFDKDQVHLTCQGHLWILQQLLFGPVTTNYLLNPSFELGAGTNWSVTADVFVSTVTSPVVLGTYAAQLAQGTTLADTYLYQDYDFTSGGIGDEIDVAAWVWVVPGSWSGPAFQQRGLYIQAVEGDTIVAESFQELTVGTPQGSWQRLETTIEVPPNLSVTIEVRLYAPNATVVWDATNAAIPESVSSALTGSDVFIIISEIIDYAQDPKRGKSPLALQGTVGGLTGTILQRAYQFSDNQGILDALQEFPSIAVADYEVVWDNTGHYRWLQVYSNPGKGSTKYNYPVEIDLGNVTDLEGGVDGSQTATTQRVLGQGQTGPAAAIGYAAFPSYLGGRVVTDGVFTQGSETVTSASADFTDADIGIGIYSLHGATQIGSVIETVVSDTEVTMSRTASLSLSGETLGIGGQILDASQSAYPDQPLSTLFGMADAYLTRTLAAQVLPTARTRADGPNGLLGVVQTGDVVPVMLNYGWLTFGPELMRVAQLILYPPTEELAMGMMVVNAT